MTGFYDRHVVRPRLIGCACGAGPIRRQRIKIVPLTLGWSSSSASAVA